ncbi:hypothetical protein S83_047601 [Arachis hypogaea]
MLFGQLIMAAAGVAKDRKCTAFSPVKLVLVASGTHWVEPDTVAAKDGNLITAATYEGHPEFIQHFMKALGGNISGSNKKNLFFVGYVQMIFRHTTHRDLVLRALRSLFILFSFIYFNFIFNL